MICSIITLFQICGSSGVILNMRRTANVVSISGRARRNGVRSGGELGRDGEG